MVSQKLAEDDSGQWLLLGSIIIAIGLAVLILFVNQSVLAGHSSSSSVLDFPKGDIRELRAETVNEAYLLGVNANAQGTNLNERRSLFEAGFDQYTSDLARAFRVGGADASIGYEEGLNLSVLPGGQSLDNVTLILYYNNGDTKYNEITKVYMR